MQKNGSSFSTLTPWAPKPSVLGEKMPKNGHEGHLIMATDFGTNGKPIYDFLLVINANIDLAPFTRYRRLLVKFYFAGNAC